MQALRPLLWILWGFGMRVVHTPLSPKLTHVVLHRRGHKSLLLPANLGSTSVVDLEANRRRADVLRPF